MAELNGSPIDGEDLKSLALVNYAHFTSMRIEAGCRVRGWDLHMQRLARDCMTVFGTQLDTENVRTLVAQAVEQLQTPTTVRVTVFDPGLEMGRTGAKANPDVLVTTRPAATLPLPALKVATVAFSRELPHVKHAGLMASLYQRRVAQQAGFDDALFTETNGDVTEGVTWNVAFIDADQIIWPSGNVLPGITAALIARLHQPSVSARVNAAEIHGMQAAFATNVSYGVRPIGAIDGHQFDTSHPLLAELSEKYLAIEPDQI
ncbi:aminotransferase class IV [Catenulispora pinisilvae]|uniref:aminotransferase class IV n=1 Tax=Catenulispora pinisilvae TaxID=2705253 RepID=UPI0018918DB2|nr:aminotransferase class IV [Catenulispora pinisilvae]